MFRACGLGFDVRGGCGAAVCRDDPTQTTLVPLSQGLGSPKVRLSLSTAFSLIALALLGNRPRERLSSF